MLEEIAREIAKGKAEGRKTETIHYQVFKNAKELRHLSPGAFCEAVGIEPSWQIEFSKMIKLAERLEEDGLEVAPIRK